MPGLNFRTYGGVSATPTPRTAPGTGGSATAAAFGPGYTSSAPSMGSIFMPNDVFGHVFWMGVVAIGLLVFVRQSLPR